MEQRHGDLPNTNPIMTRIPMLDMGTTDLKLFPPSRVPQIAARRARLMQRYRAVGKSPIFLQSYESPGAADNLDPQPTTFTSIQVRPHDLHGKQDLRYQLYSAQKKLHELEVEYARPVISSREACQDLIEYVMRTNDIMSSGGVVTNRGLANGGCCIIT